MNALSLENQNLVEGENDNELNQICNEWLEKISDLGPSDNQTQMSIQKRGRQFMVTVRMASLSLMFTLQASAHSPFVAVESAMKEALTKVHKWSAMRHVP